MSIGLVDQVERQEGVELALLANRSLVVARHDKDGRRAGATRFCLN